MAPRRTRTWVWAGRVLAVGAVAGLGGYLIAAGTARANLIAAPAALVIALAALLAPYLLPAYTTPSPAPSSPGPSSQGQTDGQPTSGAGAGTVIIADHGSVAAQHIGEVTMNPPPPGPDTPASR
jgi:hypothetical protein